MKTFVLLSLMLVSLIGFSQTSNERYIAYVNKCNTTETVTIREAGFIKTDTLLTPTYPTTSTYLGKTVIAKTRIPNSTKSIVVIRDTIWNVNPSPIYAFGNEYVPEPKDTFYNKNINAWVFREKTITMKLCKPVSYATWLTNELYYDHLANDILTNVKL